MGSYKKLAGILLILGSIQYILIQLICEAVYPGYSISANYISDLGVWSQPTAAPFNTSITLLGAAILVCAYLLKRHFCLGWKAYFFVVSGAGFMLLGLFPEDGYGLVGLEVFHAAGALMAFVAGGIAVVLAYRFTKRHFRWFSLALGAVTLVFAFLFVVGDEFAFYGLGVGNVERMMAYPLFLWFIAFGGYLLSD